MRFWGWLSVVGSLAALAVTMLLWAVGPASECSTPHEIHFWAGAIPFVLYMGIGGLVATRGSAGHRLAAFGGSALALVAYAFILSLNLPMVINTELGCAKIEGRHTAN